MADPIAVATGIVLSLLDSVGKEGEGNVIKNVRLVNVYDNPTNMIEFEMYGREYEVIVTEKATPPRMGSPMRRVRLTASERT